MSLRSKGLQKAKIFEMLSKCDFDEKLSFFKELKELLTQEALDKSEKLQEESEKYQAIKDSINK